MDMMKTLMCPLVAAGVIGLAGTGVAQEGAAGTVRETVHDGVRETVHDGVSRVIPLDEMDFTGDPLETVSRFRQAEAELDTFNEVMGDALADALAAFDQTPSTLALERLRTLSFSVSVQEDRLLERVKLGARATAQLVAGRVAEYEDTRNGMFGEHQAAAEQVAGESRRMAGDTASRLRAVAGRLIDEFGPAMFVLDDAAASEADDTPIEVEPKVEWAIFAAVDGREALEDRAAMAEAEVETILADELDAARIIVCLTRFEQSLLAVANDAETRQAQLRDIAEYEARALARGGQIDDGLALLGELGKLDLSGGRRPPMRRPWATGRRRDVDWSQYEGRGRRDLREALAPFVRPTQTAEEPASDAGPRS